MRDTGVTLKFCLNLIQQFSGQERLKIYEEKRRGGEMDRN